MSSLDAADPDGFVFSEPCVAQENPDITGPIHQLFALKNSVLVVHGASGKYSMSLYVSSGDELLQSEIDEHRTKGPQFFPSLKFIQKEDFKSNVHVQVDTQSNFIFVGHTDNLRRVHLFLLAEDHASFVNTKKIGLFSTATFFAINKRYEKKQLATVHNGVITVSSYAKCGDTFQEKDNVEVICSFTVKDNKFLIKSIEFFDHYIIIGTKKDDELDTKTVFLLGHIEKQVNEETQVSQTVLMFTGETAWPPVKSHNMQLQVKLPIINEQLLYMPTHFGEVYKPQLINGKLYEKQSDKRDREVRNAASTTNAANQQAVPAKPKNSKFYYSDVMFEGGLPLDICFTYPYMVALFDTGIEVTSIYGTENPRKPAGMEWSRMRIRRKLINGSLVAAHGRRVYIAFKKDKNFSIQQMLLPKPRALGYAMLRDGNLRNYYHYFKQRGTDMVSAKDSMLIRAGISAMKDGNVKAGLKCLYEYSITNTTKPFDIRSVLQFFQDNEEPIDHFPYPNNEQKYLTICPNTFMMETKGEMFQEILVELERKKKSDDDIDLGKESDAKVENLSSIFAKLAKSTKHESSASMQAALRNIWIQKSLIWLAQFLEKMRKPTTIPKNMIPEQFVIEYALVSLYIRRIKTDTTAYGLIENIVRGPNFYSLEAAAGMQREDTRKMFRNMLESHNLIRHVALLLKSQGYKYYTPSLDKLRTKGQMELFKERYSTYDDATDILSLLEEQDLFSTSMSEFLVDVVNKAKGKAVKVFTAPRVKPLNPQMVIEFLESHPIQVKQRYLQHLIYEKKLDDEHLHTEYALSLIAAVKELIPRQFKLSEKVKDQLHPYVRVDAGEEHGVLGEYRKSLINHLRESKFYDRDAIKKVLDDTKLLEERIELYRKMKKHDLALETYIYELKDFKGAEKYCKDVFKEEKKEEDETALDRRISMVHTQAKIYNPYLVTYIRVARKALDSGKAPESLREYMLEMINNNAGAMDAREVLTLLPDNIPLDYLSEFLVQSIQSTHFKYKTSSLTKNIYNTTAHDTWQRHWKATQRSVLITNNTKCAKCDTLIGNAVFSVFPDMTLMHYKCMVVDKENQRDVHTHPKTRRNFSKFPVEL